MNIHTFENLQLQTNEEIVIEKKGSEQFAGTFLNEYDNSSLTFKFLNHSNGQTDIIAIDKLQQLRRNK